MIDATALIAEFLGSFLLVLSVFASGGSALMIGGTLAVVIALISKISGGHVNPAISAAMFMKGSLSLNEFLAYAAVQIVGGVASLYTYRVFA
jgi:aquaporin Z